MWKNFEKFGKSARCCYTCLTNGSQLFFNQNLPPAKLMATMPRPAGKLPVITVPIRMQDKIRKIRRKLANEEIERKKRLSRRGNLSKPIISCNRSQFNHYKGQSYSKFEVVQLASRGWLNKKSTGDHFLINSFDTDHPAFIYQNETGPSFDDFDLRPELTARLKQMNITKPSNIQAMAIPSILNGYNCMCAAETGSGKTLAYLLPIVHNILLHKEMVNRDDDFNSPLALILVPSRELANQIYKVTLELTASLSINTALLVGGNKTKKIMLNPPIHKVDILISSLGAVRKLISSRVYSISKLRHVVIDESDTMLDDSFHDEIVPFLKKIKFRDYIPQHEMNAGTQLTLIGATLPTNLEVILQDVVQARTIEKITTSHLHRLMGHIPQQFLRLKPSEKPAKLLQLVKNDVKHNKAVMIFSKNSATSDYVHIFLKDNGVNAIHLHGNMTAFWRSGKFDQFQQGLCDVICCTDIASRGLDTARVQHIINYDFPLFISDYIHRVGRTGRISSVGRGLVTNFVCKPDEVALVQKIEMAARKMETLSEVNANIKGQLLKKIGALEEDEFL